MNAALALLQPAANEVPQVALFLLVVAILVGAGAAVFLSRSPN